MNIIQNDVTLSSSDDDDDSEDDMMKEMFGVSKITNMTINDDEEESEEEEDNNKNNYYSSLPENKIVNNNTTEKKKPVINTSTPISLKTIDPIYPSNNVEVVEKIKDIDTTNLLNKKDNEENKIVNNNNNNEKKKPVINTSTPINLKVIDTIYPADSVEFCHVNKYYNLCAVSTYKYDEGTKKRFGNVQFYSVNKNIDITFLQKIEFSGGVLDSKWGSMLYYVKDDNNRKVNNGTPILAVGTSLGYVSLLKPPATEIKTTNTIEKNEMFIEINRFQAVTPGEIILSLDWGLVDDDGQTFRNQLLTTHSDSTVAIWDCTYYNDYANKSMLNNKPANERNPILKWRAHDLYGSNTEVWIGMFDRWHNNQVIYTGADDGKLKGWDLRANAKPLFSIQPTNNAAGVCSGQSSKYHEYILATGGYDGIVRIWDTRMVCNKGVGIQPLTEYNVGGGVWRIKWNPNSKCKNQLVAASMRGGVHVLEYDRNDDTNQLKNVLHYTEHPAEALAYGADWNYNGEWGSEEKHLLGTCSFYNHELRYFLV